VPTGYLDTTLIIGLAKEDLGDAEMDASVDLLERRKRGDISLCTSSVAKEELDRHAKGGLGRAGRLIYLLLDDVPAVDEQFLMHTTYGSGSFGGGSYGRGHLVKDELIGKLEAILPHEDDRRHIFRAARNGIDYFVTCDEKSILRHAQAVEAVVAIKLRSPSQLVADLDAAATS
jgi:hypothetical protein